MKRIVLATALVLGAVLAAGCQRAPSTAAPQTVKVAVTDAGFVPASIPVRRGQPVVLLVTRTTDATCAKEIVIPGAHVKEELPLNREVRITFTPEKKGELRYACGMDMVVGTFDVQ